MPTPGRGSGFAGGTPSSVLDLSCIWGCDGEDPSLGHADEVPHGAPREAGTLLNSLLADALDRLGSPPRRHGPAADGRLCADDVTMLTALTLTGDDETIAAFVATVRGRGIPLPELYLRLLTPAARRLGDLCSAELCSFEDVAAGLDRLKRVLEDSTAADAPTTSIAAPDRCAAILTMPGETHTFGADIVAEFFRQAGWDVWSGPVASEDEILRIVRAQSFAVLGLSASCDETVRPIGPLISELRKVSRNPRLAVILGGPPFLREPGLAEALGADGTAEDGHMAALLAETLRAVRERR